MNTLSRKHLSTTDFISMLFLLGILFLPALLYAAPATYYPMEAIPGLPTTRGNLPQYLNNIYKILITIGALIACIRIIIAGFKWSMSGIITDKSEAKHEIQGSLFGLAILLVPYIVLNTINPNLTNLDVLRNSGNVKMDLTVAPTGGTQKYADTDPNSTVAPPGKTFQNCSYDRTQTVPQTDELGNSNGTVTYVYDSSACEASCRQKNGTFLPLGVDSGRCTYTSTANTNTSDNTAPTSDTAPYIAP